MARPARPWYWSARGCWCVVLDGRRHILAFGPKTETRDEAQRVYHRLMADRGTPREDAPPPLIGELAAAYLRECNGRVARDDLAAKTRTGYAALLSPLIADFGDRPASDLTPGLVLTWIDNHPTWGATTRQVHAALARRLTRWAKRRGLIETDPLAGLELPRGYARRPTIPGPDDAAQLLAAILLPAFRDFCQFLIWTGCRPGEAAALTAADIDLETGIATLVRHKTARKTGQDRRIFLAPEALDLCRRKIAEHPEGPIFRNSRGRPWNSGSWNCQIRSMRRRGVLPRRVIVYGLRHLFATDALEAGESVATVAALLGNSPAIVEKTYNRLTDRDEHLRAAVQRVRPARAEPPATRPASRPKQARQASESAKTKRGGGGKKPGA